MTRPDTSAAASRPTGNMLFFEQPEMLSASAHGELGVTPSDRPFDFARETRFVPLTVSEIGTAQKFFPVVFSEEDSPSPLAVVGLSEERNLFVDDNGSWARDVYVPSYVRCYPFALAREKDSRYAVVIDRAATIVNEQPEQRFFDGQALAHSIQQRVDFCSAVEQDRQRTRVFIDKLQALDLLVRQASKRQRPGDEQAERVISYLVVDKSKLKALPAAQLAELNEQGYLWPIYGHLLSLENWQLLVLREERLNAS